MRPREADPAPVRGRIAGEYRRQSPEPCARTNIAYELRRWKFDGDGARTARHLCEAIAEVFTSGLVVCNLEAPDARRLCALLGVHVEDKTARRALDKVLAGPLEGYGRKAAPNANAELRLADLLQQAVETTPRRRATLPLSPTTGSPAANRTSPPPVDPVTGKFDAPDRSRTRGVVRTASRPRIKLDEARGLLPSGPHIARIFTLIEAAFLRSPEWGRGTVADVARGLEPEALWEGQRQAQRVLVSLGNLRVLRALGPASPWDPAPSCGAQLL